MKSSLTTRLTKTIFLLVATAVAISMVAVEVLVDDIEDTILNIELKSEAEHFKGQLRQNRFQPLKTARLEVAFKPKEAPESVLPNYFRNRPPPYSNEVEVGDTTLLIHGERTEMPSGTLYVAQNITAMERREFLLQITLTSIAAGMFVIGIFVSRASATYLVRPLKKLTRDVQATRPGAAMRRLSTDYRDREFADIADAFNRFLSQLEYHIEREQSFVKLASHELRTPLAVISGALDVLEQRDQLSAADQKTIRRIRSTTQLMGNDIEVLLELARSGSSEAKPESVSLNEMIGMSIADLEQNKTRRVQLIEDQNAVTVTSHPPLVRMLIRNLLQNALRHTRASVEIRIQAYKITVRDFGDGLPEHIVASLNRIDTHTFNMTSPENFNNATFGLLIVRLACDRLGWQIELTRSGDKGTEFSIFPNFSDLPQ